MAYLAVRGVSSGVLLSLGIGVLLVAAIPRDEATPTATATTVHLWTDQTIAFANRAPLLNTMGSLAASGKGTALFNVPVITNPAAIGVVFHHAYVVYDQQNNLYMASNPVPLKLVK